MSAPLSDMARAVIRDELAKARPAGIVPDLADDADLFRDLACDGLDIHSIACAIEERFDVDLPDAAVDHWRTVASIIDTVTRLVGAVA